MKETHNVVHTINFSVVVIVRARKNFKAVKMCPSQYKTFKNSQKAITYKTGNGNRKLFSAGTIRNRECRACSSTESLQQILSKESHTWVHLCK